MRLIETNIPDIIDGGNIDTERIDIANNIIGNLKSLFKQIEEDNVIDEENETAKFMLNKNQLKKDRIEIEELLKQYKRRKKVKSILEQMDQLESRGLFTGSMKNEMVITLKVIDNLSEEALTNNVEKTLKALNRITRK